ncbi:hypothetical protein GIW50_07520 [Pseudomonas syringae]|uniref:Uncharacterized protein n=3 Tax=Pseudomonas TaxID=286 RepID=C3K2B6_PSEFS|nr:MULTISPECIES: hypothetical protein [Pseudomonas fluorescens group]MCF5054050.1 hypothetical protein [Pseudomonas syringae]MBZ6459322.1 hypothetical protein [Pseudomonas fluorescens group sp.]MBZ6461998.1 hypothetical protein [Pseudomonas fluorescens group sp.]MBZ6471448.1 hypothetical protein [Pseudomonas fluorescens group sp.]MCF5061634.1 hypothetical protein [Pseudomonas syringae]
MNPRRLIHHGPRLINILHNQLPHHVISENGLVGGSKDAHQAEASVQQLIVKLLTPHLPSPDLVRNNKQALEHPTLGRCIPDVIIDRIGGSPWGYFELKTLLAEDQLTEDAVEHDLRKLCAYKDARPEAAAVFVLVGTRKRLSDKYAKARWEKAGISAEESAFSTGQLRPQKLFDANYIAIPCGWSGKANEVMTLTWEVQPTSKLRIQSDTYRFLACMAGP